MSQFTWFMIGLLVIVALTPSTTRIGVAVMDAIDARLQRRREARKRRADDVEWEAFIASLSDAERAGMERLGERLAEVVKASTISIKDLEITHD